MEVHCPFGQISYTLLPFLAPLPPSGGYFLSEECLTPHLPGAGFFVLVPPDRSGGWHEASRLFATTPEPPCVHQAEPGKPAQLSTSRLPGFTRDCQAQGTTLTPSRSFSPQGPVSGSPSLWVPTGCLPHNSHILLGARTREPVAGQECLSPTRVFPEVSRFRCSVAILTASWAPLPGTGAGVPSRVCTLRSRGPVIPWPPGPADESRMLSP